jgi:ethanolamine utilization protein EutN
MYLGRVVGCVWSTAKNADLSGQRLLVVEPLTPELQATGRRIVATDWTGAGAGEIVYYCRGKECSFPFLPVEVPTDSNIVGIVDSIHLNRAARTEVPPEPPPAPPATAVVRPARPARARHPRKR